MDEKHEIMDEKHGIVDGKQKGRTLVGFIVMLVVLLASSLVSLTYAWFTDKKDADLDITVTTIEGSVDVASSQALTPQDLVAGNTFSKTITVNFTSEINVCFRVYAVVSTECINSSDQVETRTDIVSNTGVTTTFKGEDNKFYYSTDGQNLSSVTTTSLDFTFTFKVSDSYNDDFSRDSNGVLNTDLKTKIKYIVEYCQQDSVNSWASIG